MALQFTETKDRHQCASETAIEGNRVQCPFSTSKTVTIPAGLQYFDGVLDFSPKASPISFHICKNHEMRLKTAFRELLAKAT